MYTGPRVKKRNSRSFGPHQPTRIRRPARDNTLDLLDYNHIYRYQLSNLDGAGYLNHQLNIEALKASCGDCTYAVE